ncbi:MAG: hypothetical protein IJU16_03110 [Clostridia bacterium]|nr:hypothetical protein [Clostridia bacterium]
MFDRAVADFNPLTDEKGLYVSKVRHDCRVKTDEAGCEAAALTVAGLSFGAMPPQEEIEVVLDRPFLFCITKNANAENAPALPLFCGVVNHAE